MVLFVYRKELSPSPPPLPPPMPRLSSSREACSSQELASVKTSSVLQKSSSTFRYDHESIIILLIDNNIILTIVTQVWINTG